MRFPSVRHGPPATTSDLVGLDDPRRSPTRCPPPRRSCDRRPPRAASRHYAATADDLPRRLPGRRRRLGQVPSRRGADFSDDEPTRSAAAARAAHPGAIWSAARARSSDNQTVPRLPLPRPPRVPVLPPPGDLRPGRLRRRRLGHRLPPTPSWRSCASSTPSADDHHRRIVGGSQQLPLGLWAHRPDDLAHWPAGTSLESLNQRRFARGRGPRHRANRRRHPRARHGRHRRRLSGGRLHAPTNARSSPTCAAPRPCFRSRCGRPWNAVTTWAPPSSSSSSTGPSGANATPGPAAR
ncbi:hypothetical protein SALBM311S_11167 [Streptomyces alboniger]